MPDTCYIGGAGQTGKEEGSDMNCPGCGKSINEEGMRLKPIIFSTPMVQALLDSRKTMTRRVIKPQPPTDIYTICGPELYNPTVINRFGEEMPGKEIYGIYAEHDDWGVKCPYQPGDTLWVRETFRCFDDGDVYYKADFGNAIPVHSDDDPGDWKWQPSIHMPRSVARIFLEVTNVRVERLQEITEDDARAEGVFPAEAYPHQYRDAFAALWDSINAKRGFGWDTNPWVFVIEFERTEVGV